MQIHLALEEPPRWRGDDRLGRTAIVHVTPGLDGVSRAVNEATRGLLPAEATIVCGQPMAVDPTRGPDDGWIVWIQLQELPQRRSATRPESSTPATAPGRRSFERRTRTASSSGSHGIWRTSSRPRSAGSSSPPPTSPPDVNLEHGDIYAGSCALDQNLLWRPLPQTPGHETPVDRLFHIGASTHPGPGLGAGSGYLVAKKLTQPPLARRLLSRVPGLP